MIRPKIILSKCFCQPVRYNGEMVKDEFVEKLKNYVDYIEVCPEFDVGLGVPRKSIIIVKNNGSKRLIQTDTENDLTDKIIKYSQNIIESLKEVDGFLLKANSPSCGVGSAKLYKDGKFISKTYGIFAEKIKEKFYYLPIEDEGRLKNREIREHFLIRIFAFAELRELLKKPEIKKLVDFHTKYKYLLMTYNQKYLKELGQLVADGKLSVSQKLMLYKDRFYLAFLRKPSPSRHINTLLHIIGHIKDRLNSKEKKHIFSLLENYKRGRIDLKVIVELLKNLSYRFDNEYLLCQKYLEPYPDELNV
ncbi:MAG: DUF523 and DUF1722 domain-containing protein [candidate division WOR-3 bacterium]|nr:DUF523 and DUF1722 domain-containing protein [Candidatus Omnitrophota bacterium]MCM8807524.1 DUF523 and DUF1722 domain-containing protein [Candidatus Omnitrophota bacterium]